MFGMYSACLPPKIVSTARICALGIALLATGCASKPQTMAPARVNTSAQTAKIEIEEDGLPAQMALRNRLPGFDDPSQPWSPNYGGPQEPVIHLPDEPRRGRYSSDGEALAAARSRLAAEDTEPAPASGRSVRVINGQASRAVAEPSRVRYSSDEEALAAARKRLASMAAEPAPAPGRAVRVINGQASRSSAEPSRVQYATDAEALAAARSRLATMAGPPATSAGGTVQVLNAPAGPPVARLSSADEEALVRRAIAEHEMRRRD